MRIYGLVFFDEVGQVRVTVDCQAGRVSSVVPRSWLGCASKGVEGLLHVRICLQ